MRLNLRSTISVILLVVFAGVTAAFIPRPGTGGDTIGSPPAKWFPYFDFSIPAFKTAPREYGPLTRWWLPGNDITDEELQREIRVLADHGFAGVEVQPLTQGLNLRAPREQADRIYSWDSPSYYEHLRAIMVQAEKSGMIVDMNAGSGWPMGGPFIEPKESMRSLAVSDTTIAGGQSLNGQLPLPGNHTGKPQGMMAMAMQKNPLNNDWAIVESVIAARMVKKIGRQVLLDTASIIDLTAKVSGQQLNWQAPEGGEWQIIVSWNVPTGEKPSLVASNGVSYVIDHLDSTVVNKAYDHLLGARTGLGAYYGKPLRAVFNDSYEFHTDRIISPDFLKVFQELNGYDIRPYLASVFQQGYDHPTYLAATYPGAKPPFVFDEKENWRIMNDYDRTVNAVFRKNFIGASDQWMERRGMLHRTQAYGFPFDIIGGAAAADIPETEQLFAQGSEGFLKLVTSGAHFSHRPVITQESFVSILRAEMTTPQKIKMWADKSFACGINQLIYHGTPYKYTDSGFGKEGWNTWSSPYMPFINFSTGMNESDPFFKDILTVNRYLARCQYALRSGKPHTDVLIYMPFVDLTDDQLAVNPKEFLKGGYLEGVEPDIKGFGNFATTGSVIYTWYSKLWKTVNELESKGISWEFVNDEFLQRATMQDGRLDINGNKYQALILADLPYINMQSAKQIDVLSRQGLSLWTIGSLPSVQPSYLNYAANDRLTKQYIDDAVRQNSTIAVGGTLPAEKVLQKVSFADRYDFSRQVTREMADGSLLKFIWNSSDQWQPIGLVIDKDFAGGYWLNAENGAVEKASGRIVHYTLPPYGSVIFYAPKKTVPTVLISPATPDESGAADVVTLGRWDLLVGGLHLVDSPLMDWRKMDTLRYCSDLGVYTSSFTLAGPVKGRKWFIDLGKVYYTAEVLINGRPAGKRLFAPYSLDITPLVVPGKNSVEVRVTTSRRNSFIGMALHNDPHYVQYKGKQNTLVASGLVGPVTIRSLTVGEQTKELPQLGYSKLHDVINAMTLEEKAKLVVGTGMRFGGSGPIVGDADGRVPGAAGNTFSISRLGIPGVVMADGPAGLRIEPFRNKDSSRSFYATAWPVGTLLASSWDTTLVNKVGAAFGDEIKEYGVDVILAPGLNIQRDPLCGRDFEYYSEDPLISGSMASAIVKGIQSNGVGVSIKHFAANNQETNRNNVNAIIGERALREIYLKGFEMAVKQGNPLTVMSSYNRLNGPYTSENPQLLTTLLRNEWGFNGLVMSDWFGGKDPVAQMKAGNDLLMPGTGQQVKSIIAAVKSGELDEKVLDLNIEHILRVIEQLPSFRKYPYSNAPDLKGHAALSRMAADESMVLLKNEHHALPIDRAVRLALFGNTSYAAIAGGTGSGSVNSTHTIALSQGLESAGFSLDSNLQTMYKAFLEMERAGRPQPRLVLGPVKMIAEMELTPAQIAAAADADNAAVITIGRNAGEGADRKPAGDFYLTGSEDTLLREVSDAFRAKGKRVIVILNIGGVVETASWRDRADAMLLAWQPGQEAGYAIADLLTGKLNPSGKLTTTFPIKYEDAPSAKSFPGVPANLPVSSYYEEGIYVGYRFYSTAKVTPAFPFGYGLSYTTFHYGPLRLSEKRLNRTLNASITVTNIGSYDGKEVVELYVKAPKGKLGKPTVELKAFAKTGLLKPGQSQTLHFFLTVDDLASFDPLASAWIAEAGQYTLEAGASCADIREMATFMLDRTVTTKKVNKILAPQANIQEMHIKS